MEHDSGIAIVGQSCKNTIINENNAFLAYKRMI